MQFRIRWRLLRLKGPAETLLPELAEAYALPMHRAKAWVLVFAMAATACAPSEEGRGVGGKVQRSGAGAGSPNIAGDDQGGVQEGGNATGGVGGDGGDGGDDSEEACEAAGADASNEPYFPPVEKTNDTWCTGDAGTLGWDVQLLDDAVDFAGQMNSSALLVVQSGRLVVERYWQNWDLHEKGEIYSAGKSVVATLIGKAVADGQLALSGSVSAHLGPGWSMASAEQEALITIQHLLTMTSGLDESLAFESPAGSKWCYNTPAYRKLRLALAAATGQSFSEYIQSVLYEPIGMHDSSWSDIETRVMFSSARDMARFGLLVLAKGNWAGKAILPQNSYYAEMLNASQTLNLSYGYLWWLNGKESYLKTGASGALVAGWLIPTAPKGLFAALGKGDKKIYLVPSRNLVVVRHGGPANVDALATSDFDDALWTRLSAAMKAAP